MRLIDAVKLKESIKDMKLSLTNKRQILLIIDNTRTVTIKEWKEEMPIYIKDAMLETLRPKGDWLDEKFVAFHLTCSQCGCHLRRQKNEVFEGDYNYNFCPNCGAYMMRGKQ